MQVAVKSLFQLVGSRCVPTADCGKPDLDWKSHGHGVVRMTDWHVVQFAGNAGLNYEAETWEAAVLILSLPTPEEGTAWSILHEELLLGAAILMSSWANSLATSAEWCWGQSLWVLHYANGPACYFQASCLVFFFSWFFKPLRKYAHWQWQPNQIRGRQVFFRTSFSQSKVHFQQAVLFPKKAVWLPRVRLNAVVVASKILVDLLLNTHPDSSRGYHIKKASASSQPADEHNTLFFLEGN